MCSFISPRDLSDCQINGLLFVATASSNSISDVTEGAENID